ncbi:MAG: alpha/beta fold hydrolase [Chloroflexi bacterium]|nr:alpha/beta fold hydrolase [Chloroflexota bacterium]
MSTREDVQYRSGGSVIKGWFYVPQVAAPAPAVVFCPGYSGTRQAAFYQPYVEALVDAGIGVLLSDYRGWGDSEGPRGVIDPMMQTEDLRAGLTWLETRPEVDATRLGLVGVSFGGGHATFIDGIDPRVRAAVSISGVADGRDFLRSMRRRYEWQEFQDRLAEEARRVVVGGEPSRVHPNEDIQIPTPERRTTTVKGPAASNAPVVSTPLLDAQRIIDYVPRRLAAETRRMLWICVEGDVVVPSDHSRSMFALAPEPKRLVVLPGTAHYAAYVEHLPVIREEILAWFGRHLVAAGPIASDR